MFWIVLVPFILASVLLTAIILMQEPKQSGLGEGMGGASMGGGEYGTSGGTAGGLHRLTIWLGVIWGLLALALQLVSR